MTTLNAGDLDCTSGIAKRIYDQLTGDGRNLFSSPLGSSQADAIRAICYAAAKGVADEVNADGGVGGGGSGATLIAHRTTNQSIANNTATTVIFDAVDLDTASAYSSATGIYTVPSSGRYLVAPVVELLLSDLSSFCTAAIFGEIFQGSTAWRFSFLDVCASRAVILAGSKVLNCAAGDTIAVKCTQQVDASPIARNLAGSGSSPFLTHLSIVGL